MTSGNFRLAREADLPVLIELARRSWLSAFAQIRTVRAHCLVGPRESDGGLVRTTLAGDDGPRTGRNDHRTGPGGGGGDLMVSGSTRRTSPAVPAPCSCVPERKLSLAPATRTRGWSVPPSIRGRWLSISAGATPRPGDAGTSTAPASRSRTSFWNEASRTFDDLRRGPALLRHPQGGAPRGVEKPQGRPPGRSTSTASEWTSGRAPNT